ncbi:MAG: amidase family protein [Thermomicrobiales bacterium]
MDAAEICYLPATELRERYARRDLSPVEVTEAVLAQIERLNPQLNAFLTVTADRALAEARAAERAYAPGGSPRPLEGIPLSIKDNQATKGIRTTGGSLVTKDVVPQEDALFVGRLFAAGSVMIGKTNLPELGWKGASSNRLGEPTRNPWNPARTTGGSSAGAAAAVATGMGPLAQGGDGAGSVRIPAGFCGVFGYKSSFGLIPQPSSNADTLAHAGPLTRTVRDAALFLNVAAGADPRDRFSFSTGLDYLAACDGDIRGLRVAWSPDLGYAQVDPEVRAIAAQAAARFADLGCHVEEVNPGIPDPWPIADVIWSTGQAAYYLHNYAAIRHLLDPGRLPVIDRGFALPATALAEAIRRRIDYHAAMCNFMENYDLLLTPNLPITAFAADDDFPAEINGVPQTYLGWTAFTYPFNLTGQPAATVPCGFASDGLPVSLQIVGRWRDDPTVLRASAAFEEAFPWAQHRPPLG